MTRWVGVTADVINRVLGDAAGTRYLPIAGGTLTGALAGTSAAFSGALTAASLNGNTFTTGTGTLTLGAGKTLTASNTLTLTATDGSTLAIGTGGTLGSNAYTSTAYLPLAGGTMLGDLLFTDGLYDIGKSGATRPRNLFASGTGTFGGLLTASLGIAVPSGQAVTLGTGGLTCAQSGTTGISLGQNTTSTLAVSGSAGVFGFPAAAANVSAALDTAFSRGGTAGLMLLGTGAFGSVAGSLSLTGLTTAGTRVVANRTLSASTTVLAADDFIALTGGVAQTLTLLAASTNAGKRLHLFNRSGGNWTLDATGLGTIVGNGVAAANTFTLVDNTGFIVTSDGTKWTVI